MYTKKSNVIAAVAAMTAALLSTTASAQQARTIPQIVVTATRSPVDATCVASSVTVISAEEIAQKNKQTVTELLRSVPGLNLVSSGGVGQNVRVFMRGTNSNHTLVLMDGVPLNDPADTANAYDFSSLTARLFSSGARNLTAPEIIAKYATVSPSLGVSGPYHFSYSKADGKHFVFDIVVRKICLLYTSDAADE